ncbi:helix-turn-helix domain-containing protein [Kitasatospora sp. NPDC057692]|uniref:helix-turn-helix domain-containing protein n=1 Tax=Kitasatospora sp. NPDC057692 TaxID=3346215 RepID=UPI003680925C
MPAKTPPPPPPGFLWIEEAAKQLGVQVGTLHKWRYRKVGPTAVRHAGRLMYATDSIDAYFEALAVAAQPVPRRLPRPAVAA